VPIQPAALELLAALAPVLEEALSQSDLVPLFDDIARSERDDRRR
jgi:hypothetical protein